MMIARRLGRRGGSPQAVPCLACLDRPECPDATPGKDQEAFNAHSPAGWGSALAQHVFRSPARILETESTLATVVRRAGKRKTLDVIKSKIT